MIAASAPGKVVLWGEYAVLEGAPAAVLAVNRLARCRLEPGGYWRFSTTGFAAPAAEFDRLPATAPADAAAILPWQVLRESPGAASSPAFVTMSTDGLFAGGNKLGLGSSAALCVALQAALAARAGQSPDLARALAAHRRLQGGRGSGIDVAASFFGGCQRFQDGNARPCPDPLLHRRFVWVGEPAQTGPRLDRFSDYLSRGSRSALNALADRSEQLFRHPSVEALETYAGALKALDNAAGLGIYSAPHLAAERLARASGLVYKPCGAGGGDLGVAVAGSGEPLPGFEAAAEALGLTILDLETAPQGVRVEHR